MMADQENALAQSGGSGQEQAADASEVSILDLLLLLAHNARKLVLWPLLAGVLALLMCMVIPPSFTASVKFLPPQQQGLAASMLQSLGSLGGLASAATGLKNPADQYVAFISSDSVRDGIIKRFDLQNRYDKDYLEETRKALTNNTRASAGKENVILIEVDDKEPKVAADMANAYITELSNLLNRLAVTEAQQRRLFFGKQLEATKDSLIKAEQNLARSGISVSTLNATPSTALEGPARLRAQVTAQEVRLAAMRSYLTDNAPEIRQAQAELSALRSQLQKAEVERPAANGQSDDYIAKYREFKYQETLYDLFSRQFELAKVDESREGASIQVIDAAQIPERKSKPKRLIIVGGTVAGVLFMLIIFIFARHGLQQRFADGASSEKLGNIARALRNALGR